MNTAQVIALLLISFAFLANAQNLPAPRGIALVVPPASSLSASYTAKEFTIAANTAAGNFSQYFPTPTLQFAKTGWLYISAPIFIDQAAIQLDYALGLLLGANGFVGKTASGWVIAVNFQAAFAAGYKLNQLNQVVGASTTWIFNLYTPTTAINYVVTFPDGAAPGAVTQVKTFLGLPA